MTSATGPSEWVAARYLSFDDFVVDTVERQLYRETEPLHLTPRAFDLLLVFVQRPTELLTREELLEAVWPERIVEDANLTQTVFLLRKVLGDDGEGRRFLVTEPGRGYRFVREVVASENGDAPRELSGAPAEAHTVPVTSRRSSALWALGASLGLLVLFLLVTNRIEDPRPATEFDSVAILPFLDLSTNESSPLGLGFADAVASHLAAEIPGLAVRRSPTVIDYGAAGARPEEIGERLGVDALIHGTVVRIDDEVHVSVQLTGAQEGTTVWAASFEQPEDDLFAFQTRVAERVLRAFVSGSRRFRRPEGETLRGTENPTAYERMMEGQFQLAQRTGQGTDLARASFARALDADPGYAEAWAELSTADLLLIFYGTGDESARERCTRARQAATRALELRPDLAAPNTTLGMIELHCRYDYVTAEDHFRRGIALDPQSSRAHHWYSLFATALGDRDRAASLLDQAHRLDPLSLIVRSSMAGAELARGSHEEALRHIYSILSIDPHFGRAHLVRGLVLEQMGRYDEARASLNTAQEILGPTDEVRAASAHLEIRRGGNPAEIERSVRTIESPMHRAVVAAAHDEGAAIELLLEAVEARELWVWQLREDPRFHSLRSHPDFGRVEEVLGLDLTPSAPVAAP